MGLPARDVAHEVYRDARHDSRLVLPSTTGRRAAPADFRTAFVTDPDGRRIELVQWPAGHAVGLTAADWADG